MNPVLHIGTWRVYPDLGLLRGPPGEVGLEPKAMAVLVYLAHRPGRLISADDLIGAIWNNRPMGENPVYKCIAQLRKALGDDPARPAYIATMPRRGYRLVAPVVVPEPRPPATATGRPGRRRLPVTAALLAASLLAGTAVALAFVHRNGNVLDGDLPGQSLPGSASGVGIPGAHAPGEPEWNVGPGAGCRGTRSVEACQLYLLAEEHVRDRGTDFGGRAIALLQQAITVDPAFAMAQARMASLYLMPDHPMPIPEARELARTAIARALALDDQLAEAYMAKGQLHMTHAEGPCPPMCFDFRGYAAAERLLRRALELKPELSQAHNFLAIALDGQGRLAEAHQRFQTALRHDPLNPMITFNLAHSSLQRGDPEQALRTMGTLLDQHPKPPRYMQLLPLHAEDAMGRYHRSLRLAQAMTDDASNLWHLAALVHAYVQLGLFDDAAMLLSTDSNDVPLDPSVLHAARALHAARGNLAELAELDHALMTETARRFGEDRSEWPHWTLKSLARTQFQLGRHGQVETLLRDVYPGTAPAIDHLGFHFEIGTLHTLAASLQALGRTEQSRALLEHTGSLIADRQAQSLSSHPDLTYAEAYNHLLQGSHGLAITTLRRAVALGWRRAWMVDSNPSWQAVAGEIDFRQLMAAVHDDLATMRAHVLLEAEALARADGG